MKRIFAYLLLIFLYGCKKNEDLSYLKIEKNINLPLSEEYANLYINLDYYDYNGIDYLTYLTRNLSTKEQEIIFFNLESKKINKTISCSKQNGYSKSISSFVTIENERFFSTGGFNDSIYMSDFNNRILKSAYLHDDEVVSNLTSTTGKKVFVKEEKIYFSPELSFVNINELESKPLFYSFSFTNKKLDSLPVFFPKEYLYSECFNPEFSYVYTDTSVLISALNSHEMWSYDFKNREIKKIEAQSDYFRGFRKYSKQPKTMQEAIYNYCYYSYYAYIVYDKYREVYYRFFIPGKNIDIDDENLAIEKDIPQKMSIIILDKNYNKIGETLFENSNLTLSFFVAPDGLYVNSKKMVDDESNVYTKLRLIYENK